MVKKRIFYNISEWSIFIAVFEKKIGMKLPQMTQKLKICKCLYLQRLDYFLIIFTAFGLLCGSKNAFFCNISELSIFIAVFSAFFLLFSALDSLMVPCVHIICNDDTPDGHLGDFACSPGFSCSR